MVNQVEFHPYLYQKELLEFCHNHDIVLEAYSSLAKGEVCFFKNTTSKNPQVN